MKKTNFTQKSIINYELRITNYGAWCTVKGARFAMRGVGAGRALPFALPFVPCTAKTEGRARPAPTPRIAPFRNS
jgi:hypothetical protein